MERLDGVGVHIAALRLVPNRTVPREPKPGQVFDNLLRSLRLGAIWIEVFDSQPKFAALTAGVEPRGESGAHISQVQRAGWTGGKAPAIAHGPR